MALSRHHVGASRPLSVIEIASQAQDFEFYIERPLRSWLRSAKMLLIEAAVCEEEDNLQMAYLYVYRHADLILKKLPHHPDVNDPKWRDELSQARRAVNRNLVKLEQWKPRINQDHQRYVHAMHKRSAEKRRLHEEHRVAQRQVAAHNPMSPTSSTEDAYEQERRSLDATANRQLAVDLASEELSRRDLTKQSTRQAGISPQTVAARRQGAVFGASESDGLYINQTDGAEGPSGSMLKAGQLLQQQRLAPKEDAPSSNSSHQAYQYPAVPAKEAKMEWAVPLTASRKADSERPALPRKELSRNDLSPLGEMPPTLPAKESVTRPTNMLQSPSEVVKATKFVFKPTAFAESGAPLRTVLLPPDLRQTFLNLAHPNTARNLETCGVLCASAVSNALFISHLVIPDQTSTSDTCDATEEGDVALFDFCDNENLLVCGWIHTHPSQSCFLSSRDLHTSSGYQQMLPEAIAIVCAPRHSPDSGIFRLTDPPGLPAVLRCTQKGVFHPHAEPNLYTDADAGGGGGHVVEGPGLKLRVVDLRKA